MASKALNLTLTIDKSTNRVIFAESDKDFVDILLSFLTLPLATIVGLTNSETPPCLYNLYKSVKDLSHEYIKHSYGKEILLHPRNEAEMKCLDLAVNLEGDRALTYYMCRRQCYSGYLSPCLNTRCSCLNLTNQEVKVMRHKDRNEHQGVFLKGVRRFLITDYFVIMPASTQAGMNLIGSLGMEKMGNLEDRNLSIGRSEVLALLKNSLASESAFTDTFLSRELIDSPQNKRASLTLKRNPTPLSENSNDDTNGISIKIIIDKHENKVLYAEGSQDFVDLLFSFLTYPSGSVVKNLNKNSHITCFDNLYASALNPTISASFKEYNETIQYLVNPKLPSPFLLRKSSIKFKETKTKRYYMCRNENCDSTEISITPNVYCKCNQITNRRLELRISEGFVHDAAYIVTDDLIVNPLRSISSVTRLIANTKEGIRELVVNIGEKETLLLLKAALHSETALTDAFLKYEEETLDK